MSTNVRPQITKQNKYYISKHRYYELKHFCLQYKEWKEALRSLTYISSQKIPRVKISENFSDPTANTAARIEFYQYRILMVEETAFAADPELAHYILLSVTEGVPYPILRDLKGCPCSKDTFYDRYRRFFWLLDKRRE